MHLTAYAPSSFGTEKAELFVEDLILLISLKEYIHEIKTPTKI